MCALLVDRRPRWSTAKQHQGPPFRILQGSVPPETGPVGTSPFRLLPTSLGPKLLRSPTCGLHVEGKGGDDSDDRDAANAPNGDSDDSDDHDDNDVADDNDDVLGFDVWGARVYITQ